MDRFVDRSLTGPTSRRFLGAFLPFQTRIAERGVVNSLARVTLKLSAPGVPDIFQGSEVWNLRLVDPDNRQPVDHAGHVGLLQRIEPWLDVESLATEATHERAAAIQEMLEHWTDGRIKLFVTAACLRWRRRYRDLFRSGEYVPLETETADTAPAGVVTFCRRLGDSAVIVVTPRFSSHLSNELNRFPVGTEVWRTARILLPRDLAGRRFVNLFTRERLEPVNYREEWSLMVGDVLRTCPVAWLIGRSA